MFITQTGPKTRGEDQPKIRKHVMKDIGKARRKEGRKEPLAKFNLEIADSLEGLTELPLRGPNSMKQHKQPWALQESAPIVNVTEIQSVLLNPAYPRDIVWHFVQPQTYAVPDTTPSIERLWTGRMDPFIDYPIEMDIRSLQLMDHGTVS